MDETFHTKCTQAIKLASVDGRGHDAVVPNPSFHAMASIGRL